MSILNAFITRLFDAFFLPFESCDPLWALAAASLLTAALMLTAFRFLSPQRSIARAKSLAAGGLLGVRLYQHDPRVVFRLQGRIFASLAAHAGLTLIPIILASPILIPLFAQLELRFGARPLRQGERAIATLRVRDEAALKALVSLNAASGVAVETPPVRIPSKREAAWRIRANEKGASDLSFRLGDETQSMRVIVEDGWGAAPRRRPTAGLLDQLLNPAQPPIPDSSVAESIEIGYPPLALSAFGREFHWLAAFIVLSLVFGFALRGFFGVEL